MQNKVIKTLIGCGSGDREGVPMCHRVIGVRIVATIVEKRTSLDIHRLYRGKFKRVIYFVVLSRKLFTIMHCRTGYNVL